MALHLHLVPSLDDAIAPLATRLAAPAGDLLAREVVVVPSAGVRQWLKEQLAQSLGAASGRHDGIVANVEFLFPGALHQRALGTARSESPWELSQLSVTLLDLLAEQPDRLPASRRRGGLLPAARRIADLFDRYHFHRPAMVREWAAGQMVGTPMLGEPPRPLPEHLRWQVRLWQALRVRLDSPSPPEQVAGALEGLRQAAPTTLPSRLFLVGITSMPPLVLEVLDALATHVEVQGWITHPSPALANTIAGRLTGAPSGWRYPAAEHPARGVATLPLLDSWTRPSQSMQVLLASAGIEATLPNEAPVPPTDGPLLPRLQGALRADAKPASPSALAEGDRTLQVHRCHGALRQAEVLREVLLHTFKELPDLRPQDVLIVAPDIATMAPHLEAVFGDPRSRGDTDPLHLPVVVADRSLLQENPVAALVDRLLALPDARVGIEDLHEVAALEVVQRRLGIDAAIVAQWVEWAKQTGVRWGLDGAQRERFGLPATYAGHTWWHALERLTYGVFLPDAPAEVERGDLVPVVGLDVGDLPAIGALQRLLTTLRSWVEASASTRPIAAWCDAIDALVAALCDVAPTEEPQRARFLRQVSAHRRAAASSETTVTLAEFRALLAPDLSGDAPMVTLRSGRITATSLVPLRGVAYRVICLVGVDDGAFTGGDSDGDDLVRAQPLVGDPDPRAEQRQALAETILAARDRLVITCTGRDPRTNQEVPFVTPLQELLDLAAEVGVHDQGCVVDHPRHAVAPRNFTPGGIAGVSGAFGHQPAQAHGARLLLEGRIGMAAPMPEIPQRPAEIIVGEDLVRFLRNALSPYVRKTLEIDVWDRDQMANTLIDLRVADDDVTWMTAELLEHVRLAPRDSETIARVRDDWARMVERRGVLPPGSWAEAAVESAVDYVAELQAQCAIKDLPLDAGTDARVTVTLGDGRRVEMGVPGQRPAGSPYAVVQVTTRALGNSDWTRQYLWTWLLAIANDDPGAQTFLIGRNFDKKQGRHRTTAKTGRLADGLTVADARAKLEELVALYDDATVRPRPDFGTTFEILLDDLDEYKAMEGFADFVQHAKGHELEFRVFGTNPVYEEIFTADLRAFHERFDPLRKNVVVVGNHRRSTKSWPPRDRSRASRGRS